MIDALRIDERFSIAGRRALVTGGSIGIGRAIALGLASAGADVAIQYAPEADAAVARPDAASETCAAIGAMGRRSAAVAADFAVAGEPRRVIDHVRRDLGGIDILVICASVQTRCSFAEITRTALDQQVAVNFAATVDLLQAVLPDMAGGKWGRVLSIGSVNQTAPEPELAVYAALKAAQHNLIVNLAGQHARDGVTLNTLSPGLIATDRNRARREDPAAWQAIQAAANPMRRAGDPEDVVGAALLLCSDAGSFITGINLQVDGGGHL